MDKSEFISDLMNMMGIELPTWVIIDIDKTIEELGYHGSEDFEYHGLIFPSWNLERFLEDLKEAE